MSEQKTIEAPRPTGRTSEVWLTGMLSPWAGERPVLITIGGVCYLPLFSKPEKLRSMLAQAGIAFEKIKQIENGREFYESLRGQVLLALDPWFTPEGRVRFMQVLAEGSTP